MCTHQFTFSQRTKYIIQIYFRKIFNPKIFVYIYILPHGIAVGFFNENMGYIAVPFTHTHVLHSIHYNPKNIKLEFGFKSFMGTYKNKDNDSSRTPSLYTLFILVWNVCVSLVYSLYTLHNMLPNPLTMSDARSAAEQIYLCGMCLPPV